MHSSFNHYIGQLSRALALGVAAYGVYGMASHGISCSKAETQQEKTDLQTSLYRDFAFLTMSAATLVFTRSARRFGTRMDLTRQEQNEHSDFVHVIPVLEMDTLKSREIRKLRERYYRLAEQMTNPVETFRHSIDEVSRRLIRARQRVDELKFGPDLLGFTSALMDLAECEYMLSQLLSQFGRDGEAASYENAADRHLFKIAEKLRMLSERLEGGQVQNV